MPTFTEQKAVRDLDTGYQMDGSELIPFTSAGNNPGLDYSDTIRNVLSAVGSAVFNVLSYGADNSGATDTSVACQAAMDACRLAGGGRVYFPSGRYLIGALSDNGQVIGGLIKGGLKVGSNTMVYGDGASSILEIKADDNYAGWQKMSVIINNDYVDGNIGDPANELFVNDNIVVSSIAIEGNKPIVQNANEMEGLNLLSCKNVVVARNTFFECQNEAIDFDGVRDYVCMMNIIGWSALDLGGNAIHAGNASNGRGLITGNDIENAGKGRWDIGGAFQTDAGGIDVGGFDLVVVNNRFKTCLRPIVSLSTAGRVVIANNVSVSHYAQGGFDLHAIIVGGNYVNTCNNSIYSANTPSQGILLDDTITQGSIVCANTVRTSAVGIECRASGSAAITSNLVRAANSIPYRFSNGAHVVTANHSELNAGNVANGAFTVDSTAAGTVLNGNQVNGNQAGRAFMIKAANVTLNGNSTSRASTNGVAVEIQATASECLVVGNNFAGYVDPTTILDNGPSSLIRSNMNAADSL